MSQKKYLLGSVALCGMLALAGPASAQSASVLNGQIEALREQVRRLTQQLQETQGQVQQTQQHQAQTERTVTEMKSSPPAPNGGVVVGMKNGRPTISTADGAYSMSLTGRLHFDMGDYVNYDPKSTVTSPRNLNSGVNARRARLGVVGTFARDFDYTFIYDFGGSNDTGAAGFNGGGVQNAYLTYNGLAPVHFDLGYQDVPYTLEEAISSNDRMFIESSSAQVIATNLAANDFRSAAGVRWFNDRAWVGVYGTGPQSGAAHNTGEQFGAVGRATYQVLQAPSYSFHIGADAEGLIKPPSIGGIRTVTTFSDRPELRVDPTSIIGVNGSGTTTNIGTAAHPVTGASVYGFELAGNFGPVYGQAEYFHYNVARQGLSDLDFNGGYVQAAYTITGEMRRYNPGCGCYGSIVPAHPFSLKDGSWGAWEVAARYSVVDLNNAFNSGTTVTSTNGFAGGKQDAFTFGVNWYVNTNIRFMLDYIHAIINKKQAVAGAVPLGTSIGATMDAIALRTQVAF